MSRAIAEVLSAARVVAAYEKTGLTVAFSEWSSPGCACAAVVVAIADEKLSHVEVVHANESDHDLYTLVAHALELDEIELRYFVAGFDEDVLACEAKQPAAALGREVRAAVNAWLETRGAA